MNHCVCKDAVEPPPDARSYKSRESIQSEITIYDETVRKYLSSASFPLEDETLQPVSFDSEDQASTPDYMLVPRLKFMIGLQDPMTNTQYLRSRLYEMIDRNNMLSFYEKTLQCFKWKTDKDFIAKMKAANIAELARLDALPIDEEHPTNVWKAKLDFYLTIGDWDKARELAKEKANDSTLSTNNRLEATFALFRIAYCKDCNLKELQSAIEKARYFVDSSEHKADWSGRNKFKAYEGLYSLAVRDYKKAATNLCDCISTFESYELTDFSTIVKFTVIASMIALPRCEIQKKIVNCGIIMQELSSRKGTYLKDYVLSIEQCRYADFMKALALVELALRFEPITYPHYHQYVRDMKLKAYSQMLQSYSTVSLKRTAEIFGVTEEYIEEDIGRLTATGNLMCRIDKVAGRIITARNLPIMDRAMIYQNSIKKGDMLLNRIKRLSRIIDV